MNLRNVNKVLKQNFSINHHVDKLDPNWVTGFVDAEGCFSIIIGIPNSFSPPHPFFLKKGWRDEK